ncbi:hypothetical protein D1B31_17745 [Neobacillus notoginsengisoli]|uniref:Uncharacterized protein n=1 Tax=Neobacillus notoginsengisoli TaxID=1578198 RepID=A0A417YPM1_9BACI|nr:hypothetical protein [Neobacillus notoginsengisoli]RHW35937.1 hypothetical protein D1B31_17745 [Neobacillus notoginsengisoli]
MYESTKNTIHQLIDIYWSDIKNTQVIEETLCAASHLIIPSSIQRFVDSMERLISAENKFSPFLIIEPYGEALEQLEPFYFAAKRRGFYQEELN